MQNLYLVKRNAFFLLHFLIFTHIAIAQTQPVVDNQNPRLDQIKSLWNQVQRAEKGPFGINEYQTRTGRSPVGTRNASGGFTISQAPAGNLITVAFRSQVAEKLAKEFQFYVGNRFTINYHLLHGLAIPGSTDNKTFQWNHGQLLQNSSVASIAFEVAKHMTLEQFHIRETPDSKISKTYFRRGSAEAEHESKYFNLYMDYLLHQFNTNLSSRDTNFLIVYELARRTNVGVSEKISGKEISLPNLRARVAQVYEILFREQRSVRNNNTIAFYNIRNAIHNGMTPSVLNQLETYLHEYSTFIKPQTMEAINNLKADIKIYYEVRSEVLANQLQKIATPPTDAITTIENLSDENPTLDSLQALASLIGKMKQQIFEHKEDGLQRLLFIIKGIEYIEAKLTKIKSSEENEWKKIQILSELAKISGIVPAATEIPKVFSRDNVKAISASTVASISVVQSAYKDALSDWSAMDPKIGQFIDDILRASPLSQIDFITQNLLKGDAKHTELHMEVMRPGITYGYLVYLTTDDLAQNSTKYRGINSQTIPIFESLPLDLTVVSGTITEEYQTPLCHINLKSNQRGTPNLFLEKASKNPKIIPFLDKNILVRLEITNDTFNVREANLEEARSHWQISRPKSVGKLVANLGERRILPTSALGFLNYVSVGSKAANYAELRKSIPAVVQEGFAIPFAYYVDFIKMNGFDQEIVRMLEDPQFKENREYRIQSLENLQEKMRSKETPVSDLLVEELQSMIANTMGNRKVRFRSSTNSEDLENFSGAGLYDSDGYEPRKNDGETLISEQKQRDKIKKSLKKIWASVWNLRAFDERELFGIDHNSVYVGILVSPAYNEEEANGVILSKDITNKQKPYAVYINSQIGEVSVTNPPDSHTPDIIAVTYDPKRPIDMSAYTTDIRKISSHTKTVPTLTAFEMKSLAFYTMKAHLHFQRLYANHKRSGIIDPSFTLDIEFKIHPDPENPDKKPRAIYFKQARPYANK